MENFLVSAVIPVYNAESFLKKAVLALLNEPEVGEIILVDDASSDNSWQVCNDLSREFDKVKAFKHPDGKNHGCGATRNYGYSLTTFDYIVFADADNFILPNRFKKDQEIFSSHPEADGVYNAMGVYYYSEKAKKEFLNTVKMESLTFSAPVPPEEVFNVLVGAHEVTGSWGIDGLTLKRELLNKTGLFNTSLKLQQDVDLYLKLSLLGNLYPGVIETPVCVRGVHENHRSTNSKKMDYFRMQRWHSVAQWIKNHPEVRESHKEVFQHQYAYVKIVKANGLSAFLALFKEVFKKPKIVTERYGIFDLGFWHVFGRNKLTLNLIALKNKIQK